jgi:ADP-heptose:LPS heptosyltransferase
LWENNPFLTPLSEEDPEVETIDCAYPLINESNTMPVHFIHGFRLFLCEKLGVGIKPFQFHGDIHLSDEEKGWVSQVDELAGMPGVRFWIIVSGGKKDFTAKWWDPARCQEVVDHFRDRILFVQCGAGGDHHRHPPLDGVINLVGKTDLRQIVRLVYHAEGVICPVTMFMHLAAAVETRPGRPRNRPCVVIAGGREPSQWEAYPHHQYLHRNGCLPCCDDGGCWKSRVLPLGDGQEHDGSLCVYPVKTSAGAVIPRCLDMVRAQDVIAAVQQYLNWDAFAWRPLYAYRPQQ